MSQNKLKRVGAMKRTKGRDFPAKDEFLRVFGDAPRPEYASL
jgi:hypothetical protein